MVILILIIIGNTTHYYYQSTYNIPIITMINTCYWWVYIITPSDSHAEFPHFSSAPRVTQRALRPGSLRSSKQNYSQWCPSWSMGISGSQNGGTVPYKPIFCEDIPLHRPYKGLIYGRYLWSIRACCMAIELIKYGLWMFTLPILDTLQKIKFFAG